MRDRTLWTWHLLAGLVILPLLALHMAIMHLDALLALFPDGGHPTDWESVVQRGKSVGFACTYILMLAAALYHGLYGLRNILFELNPASSLKRGINWLLVVVGLAMFVLGTWAAWTGHLLALEA